jgi:rare lipoprotein A
MPGDAKPRIAAVAGSSAMQLRNRIRCAIAGSRAASVVAAVMAAACAQAPVTPEAPAPAPPPQTERSAPATPPLPAPAQRPEARRIEQGRISMYGPRFAGRTTASGERYEPDALTMAHRTLPFGTLVRVTNTENGRSVEVRVNDRGPFVAGRIADVSPAAARILGMVADGVVNGSIEVLAPPAID